MVFTPQPLPLDFEEGPNGAVEIPFQRCLVPQDRVHRCVELHLDLHGAALIGLAYPSHAAPWFLPLEILAAGANN